MAAARNVSAAQSSTVRCFVAEARGELADGGGLARAVDADHQHHRRRLRHARRRAFAGLQDLQQVLADQALQLGGVVELVAVHPLADAFQDFVGGAHADIGGDQRVLQLIEQIGVDLLLALKGVFERGDQPGARLLYAALEPVE